MNQEAFFDLEATAVHDSRGVAAASIAQRTGGNPLTVCDRCGFDKFTFARIHNDASVRCDCARCKTTMGFPVWYGRELELEQRRSRKPGGWL